MSLLIYLFSYPRCPRSGSSCDSRSDLLARVSHVVKSPILTDANGLTQDHLFYCILNQAINYQYKLPPCTCYLPLANKPVMPKHAAHWLLTLKRNEWQVEAEAGVSVEALCWPSCYNALKATDTVLLYVALIFFPVRSFFSNIVHFK